MPPPPDVRLRLRDAIALGLLHGPAELLPISSSGHVALVPWLLGWPYDELDAELRKAFEVALHAGTVAALLVGLRAEVLDELRALDRRGMRVLALSTLVPGVVGLAFEGTIERRLGTPRSVAAGLVVGSLAMVAADVLGGSARARDDAGDLDGLLLGVAQACALYPGMSRSGATLAVARARGFSRRDAGALSRHVALPVIAGAAGVKVARVLVSGLPAGAGAGVPCGFAAGAGAAFVATLASLRIVGREVSLPACAAYRIALAGVVLRRLRRS